MKFSCLQQDLLPILQSVSRAVGIRSTLPVLDNILFSVEGKKLKVAATNLEIGVIRFIPVDVLEEGATTVPAKTLLELFSGMGQGKVTIESKDDLLSLQSGSFHAEINGIAASEFPAIPLSKEGGITLPKSVLLRSAEILFAAAVDEGRPVLTGVLTEVKDTKLDMVATDGFRLAHRQVAIPKTTGAFKSLIPRRTLEEILKILDESEVEEVEINLSENQNQIIFNIGSAVLSSRLIEGQFPAWEKIIPQNLVTRAVLEREEFLKAIKLAAVFAKNEANIVVLTTKKGFLELKSSAKEIGSQENQVEAQTEGEELQIAFNAKFLMDALSNIPAAQLTMEFSGPLSASLIKPVGEEGLEFIVMPVRLS
ncbi:MAG: DNA polymerase III subunit beta [Patescibacteria group bacterium]